MLSFTFLFNVLGLLFIFVITIDSHRHTNENTPPPLNTPSPRRIFTENTPPNPTQFCEAGYFGSYYYNQTKVGEFGFSVEKCENGGYSKGSAFCALSQDGVEAHFEETESSNEISCEESLDNILNEISSADINHTDKQELIGRIQVLTASKKKLTNAQVSDILRVFASVANASKHQQFEILARGTLRNMVFVLSQLTETYDTKKDLSKVSGNIAELRQSTAKLLPFLCLLSSFDHMDTKWKYTANNFRIQAENHERENPGEFLYSPEPAVDANSAPFSLTVPARVLENAGKNLATASEIRTVIITYKSDLLFPSDQKALNILSVDVGLNESANSNLEEPVVIKHMNVDEKQGKFPIPGRKLMVRETSFQCVFWNFDTKSWSDTGCQLNVTGDAIECQCYHLTNFALLVVSEDVPANFTLEIVSLVGCCISIVALCITILALTLRRDLRKHKPGKILLHLCCNLCISYLVFVSGVSNAVGNPAACSTVTFLLHYFFLVAWAWMGIYSYELYLQVIKVFGNTHNRFLFKASILCYSVPAIFALLTGGVLGFENSDGQYHAKNFCWLQGNGLYIGFLVPVGLSLIGNFVVFCMVIRELRNKTKSNPEAEGSKLKHKELLLIATTATFTMGLTWLFGFILLFTRNETVAIAVAWLFALFSSLQGLGIFSLTILRREDLRRDWWKSCKNCWGVQSYRLPHFHSSASSSSARLTTARSSRTSLSRQSTKISFSLPEKQ